MKEYISLGNTVNQKLGENIHVEVKKFRQGKQQVIHETSDF